MTVSKEQLRVLLVGLRVWNCPAIDLLTEEGRERLYAAQDLIHKLWSENED
jgi:hypothetical protein